MFGLLTSFKVFRFLGDNFRERACYLQLFTILLLLSVDSAVFDPGLLFLNIKKTVLKLNNYKSRFLSLSFIKLVVYHLALL